MRIVHYISPSLFPSSDANSIHVFQMINALSKQVDQVELYAMTKNIDMSNPKLAFSTYGENINISNVHFHAVRYFARARILLITLLFIYRDIINFFFECKNKKNAQIIFISRNLYASFYLALTGRSKNLIHEAHHLEFGFRGKLLSFVTRRAKVIVISNCLKIDMIQKYNLKKTDSIQIFHDCAPAGKEFLVDKKYDAKSFNVAYFGKLYAGRGLDLLIKIAQKIPNVTVHIYGEISSIDGKGSFYPKNMLFHGFVPNKEVFNIMQRMDVLLLTYQKVVMIGHGAKAMNTARWTSPMKLFEYMSSSIPIVSSNLEVLTEVLTNEHNAMLCDPEDSQQWVAQINKLLSNKELYDKLRRNAFDDYQHKYTWDKRVEFILKLN